MKYDNLKRGDSTAARLFRQTINLLLPPRCPVTGEIVDRPGMVSPQAWSSLRFVSAPHCACCGIPFEVLGEGLAGDTAAILCGGCLAGEKPYASARASLVYDDSSRSLVLAFKHGDQTHLTVTFAPWLKTAAGELLTPESILVPVPLHWVRLLRRRYNQAALLGHSLAEITGCECWPDVLKRQKNTVTQGHLNAKQRHDNVKNAFGINPQYTELISGRHLILIDDVHTTGATLEECARVLRAAGAQRVDVLTLARVVRPDVLA